MMRWLVLPLLLFSAAYAGDLLEQTGLAYESYQKGERAETVAERNDAFNEALALYAQVADQEPSGKLFYNIGNCYYQLRKYPWALLYYLRAEKWMPRSEKVQQNMALAIEKVGGEKPRSSIFESVLFLHYKLSIAERLQLFSFAFFGLIIAASVHYWKRVRVARWALQLFGVFSSVMLFSVIVSYYFSGLFAVVVQATPIYRDAGYHYAPVVQEPIFSGRKVKVLQVHSEGQWIKISTSDGKMGYLPYQTVRII